MLSWGNAVGLDQLVKSNTCKFHSYNGYHAVTTMLWEETRYQTLLQSSIILREEDLHLL